MLNKRTTNSIVCPSINCFLKQNMSLTAFLKNILKFKYTSRVHNRKIFECFFKYFVQLPIFANTIANIPIQKH